MERYILASQSPRRRELLHLVLNEYEVIPAKGEEVVRSTDPAEVVQELSFQKAMEVAKKLRPCQGDRMIVIGADTVVAVDGEILGKPHDRADAARMIGMLQGREHHVFTGVTVCWTGGEEDEEGIDVSLPGDQEAGTASGSGAEAVGTEGMESVIHWFSFSEETAVDVFPMNRCNSENADFIDTNKYIGKNLTLFSYLLISPLIRWRLIYLGNLKILFDGNTKCSN